MSGERGCPGRVSVSISISISVSISVSTSVSVSISVSVSVSVSVSEWRARLSVYHGKPKLDSHFGPLHGRLRQLPCERV